MRRHREEEIEQLLAAVGEDDATGLDALRLGADPLRDVPLGKLPGHPLRAGPARVRHQHRLQGDDGKVGPVAKAALPEIAVQVERALVRRRRARVGSAGDQDQEAAAVESLERRGCGWDAGEGPDVVPVLGEAGDEVGPGDGAERDHEVVGVEPAARRLGGPSRRVDRENLLLDDAHSTLPEQRPSPAALGDRAVPDERPQLAEAHRELRLAVDEHDLVLVPEQALQLDGGGDASEASAENERSVVTRPDARVRRLRPRSVRTCRRTPARATSAP